MKKQILAACVAALSLNAVGCDEAKTPQPVAEMKVGPKLEPPSAISSKRPGAAGAHDASAVAMPTGPDAGVTMTEAPVQKVDVLSLAHEDGRTIDHLARARVMREQGDLAGALAEARRALYDLPQDEETLAMIDRLAKLTGDRHLRVVALERLGELRKDDAMPIIQQARVLLSMKDVEGAIKAAQEAVRRDEANPEAFQVLGRAHLTAGQLSSAITQFQKVLELSPDHGYALNNLGFAFLRANRNEEAVEVLTRAAEVLPLVAYVHNNLGVALERVGRVDEAKDAYAQSSFLSPKYVKAQVNAKRVAQVTPKTLEMESDSSVSDVDPTTDTEDTVQAEPIESAVED